MKVDLEKLRNLVNANLSNKNYLDEKRKLEKELTDINCQVKNFKNKIVEVEEFLGAKSKLINSMKIDLSMNNVELEKLYSFQIQYNSIRNVNISNEDSIDVYCPRACFSKMNNQKTH